MPRSPSIPNTIRAIPALRSIRVVGIDPGLAVTGYGAIDTDGKRHKLVEYGAIRPPARLPFADRLLAIGEKLDEVMSRLKPEACAVEESFYAVNVSSAMKLGHVRGVALVTAARRGVAVFEYSALEIKQALVGYGRADKSQVQEMVRLLLGLGDSPRPLDAADALATAICHVHTAATNQKLLRATRRQMSN